jgi:stage V sporulation protein AC
MTNAEYGRMVREHAPKSPHLKNTLWAFTAGGLICAGAEGLNRLYAAGGLEEETASALVPATLIALSALLTMLGVYDSIAKRAGAGTLVPITGFANAIVSPAMEFRSEGLVTGAGAKLFTIAGPVLVYGISASVFYGLILAILCGRIAS